MQFPIQTPVRPNPKTPEVNVALRDFNPTHVGLGSMLLKKVADEVARAVRSAFESLFSSRSSSSCLAGLASLARASNAPCMLDATDAQARHAVAVFSNGRQQWLPRGFK